MKHASVTVSGYKVPLIGIPEDATLQECHICGRKRPLQDIRLEIDGAPRCVDCCPTPD